MQEKSTGEARQTQKSYKEKTVEVEVDQSACRVNEPASQYKPHKLDKKRYMASHHSSASM